uniref:Uncharacterized protein n=1 Tax=Rhizophora mucronata TaxID=61149 RepID=A0A2P2JQT6_RHIMU
MPGLISHYELISKVPVSFSNLSSLSFSFCVYYSWDVGKNLSSLVSCDLRNNQF